LKGPLKPFIPPSKTFESLGSLIRCNRSHKYLTPLNQNNGPQRNIQSSQWFKKKSIRHPNVRNTPTTGMFRKKQALKYHLKA
jgi:hypothetical protein